MKKVILGLLIIFFGIYVSAAGLGDVNNDGRITSQDYILVRKHIMKITTLSLEAQKYADMNKDGNITSSDYILIRKKIISNDINPVPIPTTTPSKTYIASFIIQDKKAGSIETTELSCITKNALTCEITAPLLTSNAGYEILGWNINKNATVATIANGSKITLSANTTFYSISKNNTELTATFTIQNNQASTTGNSVSCYRYNGSNNCEITTPVLTANNSNTIIIGWSTDKNATSTSIGNGGKVVIKENVKYYSITSTLVNITYDVGQDIPGINVKASALSFYNNEHTKCISYNGKGCNIKWIPTIIAPGQVVHGFAKSPNGEVINVAKTTFNENTTLYARVYDCTDGGAKLHSINVMTYEVVGNVLVEVEAGIDPGVATQFINHIKKLYQDFPHMLMWNGTVSLFTFGTFQSMYGDYGGMTNHGSGFSKDFSRVALIKYNSDYDEYTYFHLRAAIHEITHAFNYGIFWNGGLSTAVSNTSDVTNLYNAYKNSNSRPLRSYSYNNKSEFLSDTMTEYFRQHRLVQYNDNVYGTYASGWTAELTSLAEKVNGIGYNYYHSIGRF